jgi:hypothetical protein
MELENVSTEPTTTESVDTGSQESSVSTPAPETGLDSLKSIPKGKEVAASTAAPAYQPNYKVKSYDKEYEIDEWVRPYIKDADTEAKFKKLYEKAYGYDVKTQFHDELKSEYEKVRSEYDQTDKALSMLGEFVKDNDFDSFFDGLNIPKNKVLEYALDLVRREQMPPDQRQAWEANQLARQQAKYYQAQNEQLLANQQAFAVQQRTFELDNAIQHPEARAVVDAYNAGMGTPQAFKDYCVQIGQAYAARGQDISAQHAVSEAVRHLRAVNPGLVQAQAPSATHVVQASQKPVIPNIQGRGTSAVKSTVKSLDDLKKRARDMSDNY